VKRAGGWLTTIVIAGALVAAASDVPEWRRSWLAAVDALSKDDGDRETALAALRTSFERGNPHPSDVLVDPAFARLRDDPASRRALSELLARHAKESTVRLTPADEPGEPLIVTGTVRDRAGKPVPGARLHVFHTDDRGYYSENGMDERNPRLFAHVLTGADGRYELRTIRPGHYADTDSIEQHVHYEIEAAGYATGHARLVFADDPVWERHGIAVPPDASRVSRGSDGVARARLDITLERK
jgi:hypothetical protein